MEKANEGFNFEKLKVYQKALHFVNFVYNVTAEFPRGERFTLVEQFRRAAISVSLNIAEGHGRSNLEFKRYLRIAKGSIRECVALITLSRLRRYIDLAQEDQLRDSCIELSMMLSGLTKSLF
jgi:four helix bundle protein